MEHNFQATYGHVRIRPLEEKDIELLRIWRNDPNKTQYLRKIGEITPEMQKAWFDRSQKNPDEVLFAIDEIQDLNRMVGSVALYHFQDRTAEVGRIQVGDDQANGRGIGRIAMSLAVHVGIQQFGLHTLKADVHTDNLAAYKSYMKMGFEVVGIHDCVIGGKEYELEIHPSELYGNGFAPVDMQDGYK